MKYIKNRMKSLNESMGMDPYIGYYDFSNSSIEDLIDELEKTDVEFSYSPDSNCIRIRTNDKTHDMYQLITSLGGSKTTEMIEDDCVILGLEPPNVPENAYM